VSGVDVAYQVKNEVYYSTGKGKQFPKDGKSASEITEIEALGRVGLPITDEGRKELETLVDMHWLHRRDVTTKKGVHRYYVKSEIAELKLVVEINQQRRAIEAERKQVYSELDNFLDSHKGETRHGNAVNDDIAGV